MWGVSVLRTTAVRCCVGYMALSVPDYGLSVPDYGLSVPDYGLMGIWCCYTMPPWRWHVRAV
eukprot:3027861-Rhodomonas_salina.1